MSSPNAEPTLPVHPEPRPPSRARRWLGALLALILVVGLAVGAWYLVKRSGEPAGARRAR